MSGHKDALRQLIPIELGGVFEDDLAIEGETLDDVWARAQELLDEIFPDTADELISDWERLFGLSSVGLNTAQRIQAVLSADRDVSGLRVPDIQEALRPFFGYLPEIEEYPPFLTEDPDCLTTDPDDEGFIYAMSEAGVYSFTVYVDKTLVHSDGFDPVSVMAAIERVKPAHTIGFLDDGEFGFYTEESLTGLDMT